MSQTRQLKAQDRLYYLQLSSFCLAFLFWNDWRYWALILFSVLTACINVKTRE